MRFVEMIVQRVLVLHSIIHEAIDRRTKKEKVATTAGRQRRESSRLTAVDAYWGEHTVHSEPFKSADESLEYLGWRFEQYPLFREFMQLYGKHDGKIILDYGCGPGNDLVGFLVSSGARKVIGVDISAKALELATERLALHSIDRERFRLIQTSDASTTIPLKNSSVDFIYCEGVLHHVSDPVAILREFFRVLRPESWASIMVYNRNSLWLHLYTAYGKMILQNAFPGLNLDEAFAKSTDGEACPISRCYKPDDFTAICDNTGFQTEFVGGYLSVHELDLMKEVADQALEDDRLAEEHKEFLRELVYDEQGYPKYDGKHAGIGGVYRLYKG